MKQFEKILWKTKQKLALSKQKWLLTIAVVIATATAAAALYSPPDRESNAATALRKQKAKITLNAKDASASSATQDVQGVSLRSAPGSNPRVVTAAPYLKPNGTAADSTVTNAGFAVDTTGLYASGIVHITAKPKKGTTSGDGFYLGNYNFKFYPPLGDTVAFVKDTVTWRHKLTFSGTYPSGAPQDSVGFKIGYGLKVQIDTASGSAGPIGTNIASYSVAEKDSGKFTVSVVNRLNDGPLDSVAHNYVYKYAVKFWKGGQDAASKIADGDTTITGIDTVARISESTLTFDLGIKVDTIRYDSIQVKVSAERASPFVTLVDSTGGAGGFYFTDSILTFAGTSPGDTTYTFKAKTLAPGTFSFKGGKWPANAGQTKAAITNGTSQSANNDSIYKFTIGGDTSIFVFYAAPRKVKIDSTVADKGFYFVSADSMYAAGATKDSVGFLVTRTSTTTKPGTWQLLESTGTNPVDTIEGGEYQPLGSYQIRVGEKAGGHSSDTIQLKGLASVTQDTVIRVKYVPTYDTVAVKKANQSFIKTLNVLTADRANTDSSGYVKDGKLTILAILGEADTIRGGSYALFSTAAAADSIKTPIEWSYSLGAGTIASPDTIKVTEGITGDTVFYVKYTKPAIWTVKTGTVGTASNVKAVEADTFQLKTATEYVIKVTLGSSVAAVDTLRGGKYLLYGKNTALPADSIKATGTPGDGGIHYTVKYGGLLEDTITVTGIAADTTLFVKYVEPFKVTTDTVEAPGVIKAILSKADTIVNANETYSIKVELDEGTQKGGGYFLYGKKTALTADSIGADDGGIDYTVVQKGSYDSIAVTGIEKDTTIFVKYVAPIPNEVIIGKVTPVSNIRTLTPATADVYADSTLVIKAFHGGSTPVDTIRGGKYYLYGQVGGTDSIGATDGDIDYTVVYGSTALGYDSIKVTGIDADTSIYVKYVIPFKVKTDTVAAQGVIAQIVSKADTIVNANENYNIVVKLDDGTAKNGNYFLFGKATALYADSIGADDGGIDYTVTKGAAGSNDTISVTGVEKDTTIFVKYVLPDPTIEYNIKVVIGDNVQAVAPVDTTISQGETLPIIATLGSGTVKGGDYILIFANGGDTVKTQLDWRQEYGIGNSGIDTIYVSGFTDDTTLSVHYKVPTFTVVAEAGSGVQSATVEEVGGEYILSGTVIDRGTPDGDFTFTYYDATPSLRGDTLFTQGQVDTTDFGFVGDTKEFTGEITLTTLPSSITKVKVVVEYQKVGPDPHYPTYVTIAKGSAGDTIGNVSIGAGAGTYAVTGVLGVSPTLVEQGYELSLQYYDVTLFEGEPQDSAIAKSGITNDVELIGDPLNGNFAGNVYIPNNLPAGIDSVEVRVYFRKATVDVNTITIVEGEGFVDFNAGDGEVTNNTYEFFVEIPVAGGSFEYLINGTTPVSDEFDAVEEEEVGLSYKITLSNITTNNLSVTVNYEAPAPDNINLVAGDGLAQGEIDGTGEVVGGEATYTITPANFSTDSVLVFKLGDQTLSETTTPAVEVETNEDEGTYAVTISDIETDNLTVVVSYKQKEIEHRVTIIKGTGLASVTQGTSQGIVGQPYNFTATPAAPNDTTHQFVFKFADGDSIPVPGIAAPIVGTRNAQGAYPISFVYPVGVSGTLNVTVSYVLRPFPTLTTSASIEIEDSAIIAPNTYQYYVKVDEYEEDYRLEFAVLAGSAQVGLSPSNVSEGNLKDTVTIVTSNAAGTTVHLTYIEVIELGNITVKASTDEDNDVKDSEINKGSGQFQNGRYSFTFTPAIPNGTPVVVLTDANDQVTEGSTGITGPNSSGTYTVNIAGMTEANVTATVTYTNPDLIRRVLAEDPDALTVDSIKPENNTKSKGQITFNVDINGQEAGGSFVFVIKETEGGPTIDGPTTSIAARRADGIYVVTVGNIKTTSIFVLVGYNEPPAADAPAIVIPTPPVIADYLDELPAVADAEQGELALGGGKPTNVGDDLYRHTNTLVPGQYATGNFIVEVPLTTTLQTITISFTGPLANVVQPLKVENFPLTHSTITVIYRFISSAQDILGTRGTVQTKATATESYAVYDEPTNTLTIYLIDIDVNALGKDASNIEISLQNEAYAGTSTEDIILYNHPVYLIPDNGVPSIGYAGYFTLSGDYPTDGTLEYRVGETGDYTKFYGNPGLKNSEIARLANGELLYFALAGNTNVPNRVFVYKPKTYTDVGGGDVNVPQLARNVSVYAASASSPLTFALATQGGQWISTIDGYFSFIVTPETVIDGYDLTFNFYKDWITVANKPVVTHQLSDDGTYYIVNLSNIKVTDLQIVVTYGQTTGVNNVDADKVWSNNGTLFINSNTNGTANVYSINGGLVKSVKVEANTITTAELPAGVYIITLNGKSTKVNTK